MTDEITDTIAEFLPETFTLAFKKALHSYHRFAAKPDPESAKDFGAHHTACKTALGHLSALLKLQELWRKAQPSRRGENPELEALLRQARTIMLGNDCDHIS